MQYQALTLMICSTQDYIMFNFEVSLLFRRAFSFACERHQLSQQLNSVTKQQAYYCNSAIWIMCILRVNTICLCTLRIHTICMKSLLVAYTAMILDQNEISWIQSKLQSDPTQLSQHLCNVLMFRMNIWQARHVFVRTSDTS